MANQGTSKLRKPQPPVASILGSPQRKAQQTVIEAKAARIEKRVRDHHATGHRANIAQIEHGITTTQFAAKYGFDSGTLRRWKVFAKLYSSESGSGGDGMSELDELCRLRRPNGLPLHWGFLPYLMSVKNPKKRRTVAAKAAASGWSPALLHAEIRQIEGRSKGHGRKVELPITPMEGLLHILREGRLWLARSKKLIALLCSSQEAKTKSPTPDAEAAMDEVAKLLKEVRSKCGRLGKEIEAAKSSRQRSTAKRRRRKAKTPE